MTAEKEAMAMRRMKEREESWGPVRRQREVIRDVMLSAGQCATWLTLEELARLTHYPPASISAQLRHLRKPRFGGYAVVKRSRRMPGGLRGDGFGTLWEYCVAQVQRSGERSARERRRRKTMARRRAKRRA